MIMTATTASVSSTLSSNLSNVKIFVPPLPLVRLGLSISHHGSTSDGDNKSTTATPTMCKSVNGYVDVRSRIIKVPIIKLSSDK